MSMQSFRLIRFVDKNSTLGGGANFTPFVKPMYKKKLERNTVK